MGQGLVADLRADFVAFRTCAGTDAGHQVLGTTEKILLHGANEVGGDTGHCGSPGRVCKTHGLAVLFRHEDEGTVGTLADQDKAGLVRVQGVCLACESWMAAVQDRGPVDLFQIGTLFGVQGLGHLPDGMIRLVTNEVAVRTVAGGYEMGDIEGIQRPEASCDPGILLPGQDKTTV
jgi:hypothetical protein